MMITANWGLHVFSKRAEFFRPILDGFRLGSDLDVEQLHTTEAQNPLLNKRGDMQDVIPLVTLVHRSVDGTDPMTEYNSWVRDLGKSQYFLLNMVPVGFKRYILQAVAMQNVTWAPDGSMLSAEISLEFLEDVPQVVKSSVPEKSAVNVGPSKAEKKSQKGAKDGFSYDIAGAKSAFK